MPKTCSVTLTSRWLGEWLGFYQHSGMMSTRLEKVKLSQRIVHTSMMLRAQFEAVKASMQFLPNHESYSTWPTESQAGRPLGAQNA